MSRVKFSASCFLFLFTLFLMGSVLHTDAFAAGNPRYASIVMDADTGLILHQRHANKSLHPASLTKVMTLLLVFEALEQGRIGLNDRVRVSRHAADMVPSKLGLAPGGSIRVKDAIYALVTKSANDVAVALAEHLAGSERNFAQQMTDKARAIGMTRTRFVNASGLHDKRQVSTARDMAKMARYVIQVHPDYYRYFSRKNFTYAGKTYRNHNRLMDTYPGMDGMKTGYVTASGFNLIASAVQGDRRIIGVVFGGRSSNTRNAHMKDLLDIGFDKIKNLSVAKAEIPVPGRKPAIAKAYAALNNPALQKGFERLIGEGDFDPASSQRIKTGLMAIAAHTGDPSVRDGLPELRLASTAPEAGADAYSSPSLTSARPQAILTNYHAQWSVQIGAFTSRVATDSAIQKALKTLPSLYSKGQPVIAPLRTADGWLFRGRLNGYTKEEALAACDYIRDCLPVAPQN